MARSDTFRSVVLAGITAGATKGICAGLGIAPLNPSSTWGQSLAHHSVGSAVRAAFQMTSGEPVERALSQAALSAAMGAASQQGAAGIGRLMAAGDINALTQKVLHGFNGAASAALMNPKDMSNAAFAGALGAIVAETFADLAAPDKAEFNERVLARAEREGVDLTNDGQRHALVRDELSGLMNAGQMISATLAMLMGKDPDIAASAAKTALENNCLHVIAAGVIIAYRVSKVPGVKPAVKAALRRAGVEVLKAMAEEGMDAAPGDVDADTLEKSRAGSDVKASSRSVPQARGGAGGSALPPDWEPENKERRSNCTKQESSIWKDFQNYRGEYKTDGDRLYKWDHLHNDIEVFSSRGEHIGSMDPATGALYKTSKGYTVKL